MKGHSQSDTRLHSFLVMPSVVGTDDCRRKAMLHQSTLLKGIVFLTNVPFVNREMDFFKDHLGSLVLQLHVHDFTTQDYRTKGSSIIPGAAAPGKHPTDFQSS